MKRPPFAIRYLIIGAILVVPPILSTHYGTIYLGKDNGIKQTWIFAHPDNKKMTGPYPRFRIMLYDVHYRILLNHFSHKIDLITNTENKFVYGVKVLTDEKQQFFYEWHVSKGNEENCTNCWFTTAVSMPLDQGNSI